MHNFVQVFFLFKHKKALILITLLQKHEPDVVFGIHNAKIDNASIFQTILRDLVPIVQFKKCEKYSWRSDTFSQVPGF